MNSSVPFPSFFRSRTHGCPAGFGFSSSLAFSAETYWQSPSPLKHTPLPVLWFDLSPFHAKIPPMSSPTPVSLRSFFLTSSCSGVEVSPLSRCGELFVFIDWSLSSLALFTFPGFFFPLHVFSRNVQGRHRFPSIPFPSPNLCGRTILPDPGKAIRSR